MRNGGLPDRKHPHRLAPGAYCAPGEVVSVSIHATRDAHLIEGCTPDHILAAMHSTARRLGVRVHAYCVMPGHFHVVCSVTPDGGDVALWVRRFKSASSRRAGIALWQRSYWDRHARRSDDVLAMVEYVIANPERKGLCQVWTEWPWSWSEWHSQSP